MPSFGKGAVQYPLKLASLDDVDDMGRPRLRSGSVRVTIARLIAPRGGAINGVGIMPDQLEADPVRQLEAAVERAAELLSMTAPRLSVPMVP